MASGGKVVERPSALAMPSGTAPVTKVACGMHHVIVLTSAGQLLSMGNGEAHGELGTGRREWLEAPAMLEVV